MILWHRLLGLYLDDFFSQSAYEVEVEVDISEIRQYADIVAIRKNDNLVTPPLPDGFTDLLPYNVISFKSLHEPFDQTAILGLCHYYVGYMNLINSKRDKKNPLPMKHFRAYGVTMRFPDSLCKTHVLREVSQGVYENDWGDYITRIIVTSQIPVN